MKPPLSLFLTSIVNVRISAFFVSRDIAKEIVENKISPVEVPVDGVWAELLHVLVSGSQKTIVSGDA